MTSGDEETDVTGTDCGINTADIMTAVVTGGCVLLDTGGGINV